MIQGGLTPENTEDLEFRVEKFEYNQYQLFEESIGLKGILRVATVPFRILKVKDPINGKPQFYMQSVHVPSFVNKGKYGTPNPAQLDQEEEERTEKVEVTDHLDVLAEPYNIYITINTKPYFAIRAKSSVIKAEVLRGRYDYYGNPMFSVEVNTAISYSFSKGVSQ